MAGLLDIIAPREIKEMTQAAQIGNKILEMVRANEHQRLNPNEVIGSLSAELEVSMSQVRAVLNELVRRRKLVFTYRDPFTYVEIPYNDRPRRSHPMKVIIDERGNPWICHYDVDPSDDLAAQGCWQIREDGDGS